ncbi:MAG: S8 family serine peptidase [Bryobacteraceae bacterium]
MQRTSGTPDVVIALIDGPVALGHPDLESHKIRSVGAAPPAACASSASAACIHGTYIAGILCARRSSVAPAICPGCTLLLHPIFTEGGTGRDRPPSATPDQLAAAVVAVVQAGARVVNLSVGLSGSYSAVGERGLENAFNYAASRGAICVAAAGNEGTVGGSSLIRHTAVIPVAGCDSYGWLAPSSNLGTSIGVRGLRAPSEVPSLSSGGGPSISGTSVSAALVTGAIALLWSEFPRAAAGAVRAAITRLGLAGKRTLVPPLLDAWGAYEAMAAGA